MGIPVGSIDRPRGQGFGARIGDSWVRLGASRQNPLRLYSRDSLAGRESDQSNSYENVLDLGFDFSRPDLTGGEGLEWFPRPVAADRQAEDDRRYWDSMNMDISEAGALQLTPTTEEWWDSGIASANGVRWIDASESNLYVLSDQIINRFDSWSDTVPDSTHSASPQTIVAFMVNREDLGLYQDNSGDMYVKDPGASTWTQLGNASGDLNGIQAIWFAKDRVIVSRQTGFTFELGELTWDGGLEATVDVFDTMDSRVYSVIDASTAVLAISNDGYIRSYVPQTDTAGGAPALTIRGKTQLPGDEIPYAIAHNFGVVIILTGTRTDADSSLYHDIRAYNGTLLDERFDFVVGELQLIREWTEAKEPSYEFNVSTMAPQIVTDRDSFYWLVREDESDNKLNIWTQNLVTRGVSRHIQDDMAASDLGARGLVSWKSRLVWGRNNEGKVYRSADTYATVGWLITPNINFGINTSINWISATLHAENIINAEGAQIELWLSTDPAAIDDWQHTNWQLISRVSNQIINGTEISLSYESSSAALQIRVYPNQSGAGTPKVTRFSLRGLPSHRDFLVELPVSVSDYIEVPNRVSKRIPGYGNTIRGELLQMQGKFYDLEVVEPPVQMRGIVDAIGEPIQYISDRGSVGTVMVMLFRGTLVTGSELGQTTGDAGMGLGLMGVATLGIGQSGVT